jgi:aspartyl-tRNA(Asn)/glutamyl-tRNA(Gln) amidotransferase subunit A
MYLSDVMTVAVNLVGIPALSLPVAMADNLPVGLQLMAPQRADRALLGLAKKAEEALV